MEGEPVAWFEIRIADRNQQSKRDLHMFFFTKLTNADTYSSIEICGNEQFSLGRDPEQW
jgi:hypothetical protein